MDKIHRKVFMMFSNAANMANDLMKKAVNKTLNQWKSLQDILKDSWHWILEQPVWSANETSEAAIKELHEYMQWN